MVHFQYPNTPNIETPFLLSRNGVSIKEIWRFSMGETPYLFLLSEAVFDEVFFSTKEIKEDTHHIDAKGKPKS